MASFNRVFLLGNLTRAPEVRYTPSGIAVSDLRLAVNERVKKDDQWVDQAIFLDVTVWDRTAQRCGDYLEKGSSVLIEGRLQMDTWEKDGEKRSKLKVVADRVQFLERARRDGGNTIGDAAGAPGRGGLRANAPEEDSKLVAPPAADNEDDIPF